MNVFILLVFFSSSLLANGMMNESIDIEAGIQEPLKTQRTEVPLQETMGNHTTQHHPQKPIKTILAAAILAVLLASSFRLIQGAKRTTEMLLLFFEEFGQIQEELLIKVDEEETNFEDEFKGQYEYYEEDEEFKELKQKFDGLQEAKHRFYDNKNMNEKLRALKELLHKDVYALEKDLQEFKELKQKFDGFQKDFQQYKDKLLVKRLLLKHTGGMAAHLR